MANIKDFESKRKKTAGGADVDAAGEKVSSEAQSVKEPRAKRRPITETAETDSGTSTEVKVVDVESGIQDHSTLLSQTGAATKADDQGQASAESIVSESSESQPKIEIHFTGSEMIRAKFPRPFNIIEKVATDWMHEGDFSKIPLGHPLAEYAAQEGLKRAKKLEKQILESPTTEKVATQVLMAGMKAQGKVQELKSKISELRSKVGLKK